MNNAERYHFADFTRNNYRRLLRLAKQRYNFRTYTDFNKDESFVLWRHDVDASAHAARKLAQVEAEEGIVATYFLYLHSKFYNLLESEVADCVQDIITLGHTIGLHFDTSYYNIDSENNLVQFLQREKRILREFFGRTISVFSFHNPTLFKMDCQKWEYAGLINTSAGYFKNHVGYCSDSNGYWRYRRLDDVLRQGNDERLQALTHPEFWQDTVMSPRQRIHCCINEQAEKTKRWYDLFLKESGRENVDWN